MKVEFMKNRENLRKIHIFFTIPGESGKTRKKLVWDTGLSFGIALLGKL